MTKHTRLAALPALLLAVAALPFLASETAAMPKTFHLTLTGDHGTEFQGRCTLETEGGSTDLPLAGTVPHSRDITADAMTCRLESAGRLIVDVEHQGSRSRSATNGGTITLSLR